MRSMSAGRMTVGLWCFFSYVCLSLCSAEDISCHVTQDAAQTTYNISGKRHVSSANCEYTWANASHHVLAHNKAEIPELVMRNNIDTLVTSKCFDMIIYARLCVAEGEGYTANCTFSCSGNVGFQEDKAVVELSSHSWIAAVVVVIILVLVMLIGFLCYKCRNTTPSVCSCSQLGCVYTAVKTQNADVEAGRQ